MRPMGGRSIIITNKSIRFVGRGVEFEVNSGIVAVNATARSRRDK